MWAVIQLSVINLFVGYVTLLLFSLFVSMFIPQNLKENEK